MADKPKKMVAEELKTDPDKMFLEKNKVKETMGDLISQLAANRPSDPLKFMADYFQSTYEQSNRLEKSYQTILLTHHSRPAFRQNLIKAFGILNQTKVAKNLYGINGIIFGELLNMLLREAPARAATKIKEKLSRRPNEAVAFPVFQYSATCISIFNDYLEVAAQLYELLDVRSTGLVDRLHSEAILNKLKSTFVQMRQDKTSGVEACLSLSPDGIYSVLSQVPNTNGSRSTINHDQFLEIAADVYLPVIQAPTS